MKKDTRSALGVLMALAALYAAFTAFAADYKLGPGDVISLAVWDEPDLSGDFRIDQKGELTLNWVPPFEVRGLTIDEVRSKILDILGKKYIKSPRITSISIKEYSSNKVSLLGEFKKPGDYKIEPDSNLLGIILESGGPSQAASDSLIFLRRSEASSDGQGAEQDSFVRETYSINQLMTSRGAAQDVKLENGDVLYLPGSTGINEAGSVDSGVTVLGAVTRMGIYKYRDGYTAMNAIIDAGGFTKFASKNKTMLVRGAGKERKTLTLRMGDVMERGDKSKDVILKPGDTIIAKEGFL